jgi:cyclopropane fatty-acyl-phospholipid synthase-like methyltransferase
MNLNNEAYRLGFTKHYEGTPIWDIGRPQPPFVEIADQVNGSILDIGCGTGTVALFFAAKGNNVTAIDFVDQAIDKAKKKAAQQNLSVDFQVKDVFTLTDWNKKFANVIDSGLFHVFADDEVRREQYLKVLEHVLESGGRLYLLVTIHLTQMTLDVLKNIFSDGWEIESLREFIAEVPENITKEHPETSWNSWFAVIRRK